MCLRTVSPAQWVLSQLGLHRETLPQQVSQVPSPPEEEETLLEERNLAGMWTVTAMYPEGILQLCSKSSSSVDFLSQPRVFIY